MTERRVVGLDLSLTATGMAEVWVDEQGTHSNVDEIRTAGHRGDSLLARRKRIHGIASYSWRYVGDEFTGTDLVVVEGPSIMSQGGSNWDRAGLWWQVVAELLDRQILVAVAPPMVVKKWSAGKGSATKAEVAVAVSRLWPDSEAQTDNEWDALALATMGAQRLGIDVQRRAHHAAALEKVEWPEALADQTNKTQEN